MANPSDHSSKQDATSATATSLTLLERLRADDQTAWHELVQLYYPLVYRWCRTAGLQEQDSVDVIQEVFRAVAASLANFRRNKPGDSFRGWLRGITRHKLQDFWRQRQLQQVPHGGTTGLQQMSRLPDLTGEEGLQQQELGGVACRAVELVRSEFEDQTWQAAWQVLVNGETVKAVAAALRMTPNAVYKAKARVIRRVREKLSDLIEPKQ